jgi:hypothetical protein
MNRRSALKSILLAGVAPFFVPAERLMRIKPIVLPPPPVAKSFGWWRFYKDGVLVSEKQIPLSQPCAEIELLDLSKPIEVFLHEDKPVLKFDASPDETTTWNMTTFRIYET